EAGGHLFQTWQEAVEREISANGLEVSDLCMRPKRIPFTFCANSEAEPILDADRRTAGRMVRRQEPIEGAFEVSAERLDGELFRMTVRIMNVTSMNDEDLKSRDEALMRALVSTHTVLGMHDGQ